MDGPDNGANEPARRPRNPVIGIIGKSTVNDHEAATLRFIGQAIARLGHKLALIPAKGTADKVREGFEVEGGEIVALEADVIGAADHTLVYPDTRLLNRLRAVYPDIEARDDVLVIREDQLEEWKQAVIQTLDEKGVETPA
ncbi:MAG TPA: hypothetical protein VLA89_04520 [Gemmatimonadales bacterium]|nr:hypothetical protein [Gemmatimonadales bacterium]